MLRSVDDILAFNFVCLWLATEHRTMEFWHKLWPDTCKEASQICLQWNNPLVCWLSVDFVDFLPLLVFFGLKWSTDAASVLISVTPQANVPASGIRFTKAQVTIRTHGIAHYTELYTFFYTMADKLMSNVHRCIILIESSL